MKTLLIFLSGFIIMQCNAAPSKKQHGADSSHYNMAQANSAFNKLYPNIKKEKWVLKDGFCEVKFKLAHRRSTAYFSSTGEWLKTESRILWSKNLPKIVLEGWKSTPFASWTFEYITKVDSFAGKPYYVLQMHKDWSPNGAIQADWLDVIKLYFTDDGALLKKEQIE
jgi:hypothetical protein